MEQQRWKIKDRVLYNTLDGQPKAIVNSNASMEDEKIMELAPEAMEAIEKFVAQINSGTFKPKTAVKDFERILDKFHN